MQPYEELYKEPETLEWKISSVDTTKRRNIFMLPVLILIIIFYSLLLYAILPDLKSFFNNFIAKDFSFFNLALFIAPISPVILIIFWYIYKTLPSKPKKEEILFSYNLNEKGLTKTNFKTNLTEFYPWKDFEYFYKISDLNYSNSVTSAFFGDIFYLIKKNSNVWWPQYINIKTTENNSYQADKIISKYLPRDYPQLKIKKQEVIFDENLKQKLGWFYYFLILTGAIIVIAIMVTILNNNIKIWDKSAVEYLIIMLIFPIAGTILRYLIKNDKIKNNIIIFGLILLSGFIIIFTKTFFDLLDKFLSLFF